MLRITVIVAMLFSVSMTGSASAQGLDVSNDALKETIIIDENGATKVTYVPAEFVLPGDIIMYSIHVTNSNELDADNIVLVSQVPSNLTFIEESAFKEGFSVLFSVNSGETYATREDLVVIDDNGDERPAEATDITNIQWTMVIPLASGESEQVVFRAFVN